MPPFQKKVNGVAKRLIYFGINNVALGGLIGLFVTAACSTTNDAGEDAGADSDKDGEVGPEYVELNGVDILVVLDGAGAMDQNSAILATGVFTLVEHLCDPVSGSDYPYPAVDEVRVGVISSNLGLQYGPEHSTDGFPYGSEVCTGQPDKGDNGRFHTSMPSTVTIESGRIPCQKDAIQCPEEWFCKEGYCVSPPGNAELINCPQLLDSGRAWTESAGANNNEHLAAQAACLATVQLSSCPIEQQLEAPIVALTRDDQSDFLVKDHLLVVLVVTDEEDCSIADKGLFDTPEWRSGARVVDGDPESGLINTACNLPESNEDSFLFDTNRFGETVAELKGGWKNVFFAAIAGVPHGEDSPCQGRGDKIESCLDADEMKLEVVTFGSEQNSSSFRSFRPACTREKSGVVVTSARPGRRYVEVAQSFGAYGFVSSICNEDWTPVMLDIARMIAQVLAPSCTSNPS